MKYYITAKLRWNKLKAKLKELQELNAVEVIITLKHNIMINYVYLYVLEYR